MYFEASLNEFQKALGKVIPVIPSRATVPVLEHLKLNVDSEGLKMISTDQDITIMVGMPVSNYQEGGVLVPAKKLNEISKALGNSGSITFDWDENTSDVTIKAGRGVFKMKGLEEHHFIALPELFKEESNEDALDGGRGGYALSKEQITYLSDKTVFAVSTDEFRPAMTGVLFQFNDNHIYAVSTDSYRLVRARVSIEDTNFTNLENGIIIPARAMELLRKVDADVHLYVVESNEKATHARFEFGDTVFVTRLLDEKFPPYEAVLPKDNDKLVTFDKAEMLDAIKRVSLFTNQVSKQLILTISQSGIELRGKDDDIGLQSKEEVNCEYNGEPFDVGFNFKYLEEAISHITPITENNIVATFSESGKPALMFADEDGSELLMLIMPVKIYRVES